MDPIFRRFLERQTEEGLALAAASDLIDLEPLDGPPAQHFIARFRCKGLVREARGAVVEADEFILGIWLPDDYLRHLDPMQLVSILAPPYVYHPNVADGLPFVCLGRLGPGTPLVDILHQAYEVLTFQKYTCREDDALNRDACAWTRRHLHVLPLDRRPLKRRPEAS